MLSRYVLAVLLVCFVFDAKSDDEGTSQLVRKVNEKSSGVSHTECRTPDNKVGYCIAYYLCDPDTFNIFTDGSTLLDIRDSDTCDNYLHVCCAHERVRTHNIMIDSANLPGQTASASSRPLPTVSVATSTESLTEPNEE